MTDTANQPTSLVAPAKKDSPGAGRKIGKVVTVLVAAAILIALFVWKEVQRREIQRELTLTQQQVEELRQSNQQSSADVGKEILAQVRHHIEIPEGDEPTVATIVNVEQLRKDNPFYERADNGDFLIVTKKRAILYDADKDVILDVVPVTINDTSPSSTPSPSPR